MTIFENYNDLGKNTKTTTREDFSKSIGEEGTKDIIKSVLLGGNVRDTTEFITQRRLLNSYASMIELFTETFQDNESENIDKYMNLVTQELSDAKGDSKIFYLWLLGLTKKGFDNIAREQLAQYSSSFMASTKEAIEDFENEFGSLTGELEVNGKKIKLSW